MPNIHNGVEKAPSHDRLFNQTVRILVLPFHPSISTSLTFTAHCPFQTLAVHTHRYFNWSRSFQLDNNEAHFEASSTPEAHISYIAVAPVANITKQPLFHTVTGISPVASKTIVFHSISMEKKKKQRKKKKKEKKKKKKKKKQGEKEVFQFYI